MDVKILAEATKRGHEQVTVLNYPQVGLKAIVAIHNTALGPALGGCRMRVYQDEGQAIDDVLRLSEGMTYKSAIAGLKLGGGKSCLLVNPEMKEGRTELFLKFAECLNNLNGRYITAEDMGTTPKDISVMRQITKYAAGHPREEGGSGDPSPWTAKGVYNGLLAACDHRYGSKELRGKKIGVQGVGHVGMFLVERLVEAGAKVYVTDTNQSLIAKAVDKFGVEAVSTDAIYDLDMDIYSPCAIGQTVNAATLARLKCGIIAGAANNQLSDASVYSTITEKKILYCPDFVLNSGGVISVSAEYHEGGWKEAWVREKVQGVQNTIHQVFVESEKRGKFPEVVALELAKERVAAAEKARSLKT